MVAALLRSAFGEELVESGYRRIDAVGPAGRGRADLVCALGRAHGMNPKRFVDFIANAAHIKQWAIQHVRVQGERTTFTVPAAEADKVVNAINSREGAAVVSRDQSRRKPPGRKYPKKGGWPGGKPPYKKRFKPKQGGNDRTAARPEHFKLPEARRRFSLLLFLLLANLAQPAGGCMTGDERKTKKELIEELDRLRALLDDVRAETGAFVADELPLFIFEMDLEGSFRFANRYALENFGYTEADIRPGSP